MIVYEVLVIIIITFLGILFSKLGIHRHGTNPKTLKIFVICSFISATIIYVAICVYYK